MWINFNDTLIKTEDILYVNQEETTCYGYKTLILVVKTNDITITSKYSNNCEGQLERKKDFQFLFDLLKED